MNVFEFITTIFLLLAPVKQEQIVVPISYDYTKLMAQMSYDESRGQCHVWGGGCYGRYQMDPKFVRLLGYSIPLSCEMQDSIVVKAYHYLEAEMDKEFGGRHNWEFRTIQGIYLTKTNVLEAMWGAPYGTIVFLKKGINWSNGIWSVKGLLEKYEAKDKNDTFYEYRTFSNIEQLKSVSYRPIRARFEERFPDSTRLRDQWSQLVKKPDIAIRNRRSFFRFL